MKPIPELQFDAYIKAALRSERAGVVIIGLVTPFVIYELLVRRMVDRRIAAGRVMPISISRLTLVIECCLPLIAMPLLIATTRIDPYTLLVSPAYAMILVILALSALQLDPWRSIASPR